MIFEVRATMFFDIEDEATGFFNDCLIALPKATVVNPCQADQECCRAELIRCFHDETPHEPCELINEQDNCPECP